LAGFPNPDRGNGTAAAAAMSPPEEEEEQNTMPLIPDNTAEVTRLRRRVLVSSSSSSSSSSSTVVVQQLLPLSNSRGGSCRNSLHGITMRCCRCLDNSRLKKLHGRRYGRVVCCRYCSRNGCTDIGSSDIMTTTARPTTTDTTAGTCSNVGQQQRLGSNIW
jgi:hypothetical protein